MRTLRALALMALTIASIQGVPAVAGALDEIRETGELRLAYRMESPPFSSKAPDALAPEGFTIDICRIIARDIQSNLGLDEMKITWVKVDADERIQAIAEGRAHIECGITSVTLSRQEHVDFSNLFYATGASLMILNSSEIRNIDDLGNKRVSVVEGTTTEQVLTEALEQRGINARIVRVPNHADALKRLVNKNTDAMAADQATLFGIGFKSQGEQRLVITEDMLSFEPYALPLPRNDADFRLVVNRSLSNLYQRGDVGRSWERHFGVHGVKPTQMLLTLYRLNSFAE
ncbi:MAG: amino acid ABC transporter substrate-binding protein [Gammaproteobacteria bacterium]|nr:MAG: amino acid ABC transporter substrate-binding protein [Gammaproteobacteria bacterium]